MLCACIGGFTVNFTVKYMLTTELISSGLGENGTHRLICLIICSPADRTVWEGLEGVDLLD